MATATESLFTLPENAHTHVVANQELHVLAVDDSLVDRKVIERLLKISSCKVTAVDSGRSALQYLGLDGGDANSVGFNALKVNMIITDYWMPGMTGYELLKKIKESSAFREIPVVIMSSENVLPRINRCLEEGAEEFIVKPVKLSDVKRLKDHILKEDLVVDVEIKGTHKRKLESDLDEISVSSSSTSSPLDLSSPSSPASSVETSSSPLDLDLELTSSPSSSPLRRQKMSNSCSD